jgi:hypothetical protein
VIRAAVAGAALLALAATTSVLARTQAPPDPQVQALADGCERNDTTLHTLQSPNWVRVNDRDYPAAGPQPPLRTASGIVMRDAGNVHTSGGDNPVSHTAYDLNFNVKVDAAYSDLVAKTNTSGGIHVEREEGEGTTPAFIWPEPGDRVTLLGYWVWDCDHFTTNGEVTGEETELHPWVGLWIERAQSVHKAGVATGNSVEADLYLTSDRTEAGTHADCAHATKHDQSAFKTCVTTAPNQVDISGHYEFSFAAPPGLVKLGDGGSVNAPPMYVQHRGRRVYVSFTIPSDGRPHLIRKAFYVRKPGKRAHLRVTFDKILIRRSMDPACIPVAPPGCGTPETTRDDQVTRGPTGEWNFYSDVAGLWNRWTPSIWNVRDGQTIKPRKAFDVWVAEKRPFRVFVWARECDWGTLALGGANALSPCPKQSEVGNRGGDDVPGAVVKVFPSVKAALGTHSVDSSNAGSTCPAVNKQGCYRVTFTIRRMG